MAPAAGLILLPATAPLLPAAAPASSHPKAAAACKLREGPVGGRCRCAVKGLFGVLVVTSTGAGHVWCGVPVDAVVVRWRGWGLLELLSNCDRTLQNNTTLQRFCTVCCNETVGAHQKQAHATTSIWASTLQGNAGWPQDVCLYGSFLAK